MRGPGWSLTGHPDPRAARYQHPVMPATAQLRQFTIADVPVVRRWFADPRQREFSPELPARELEHVRSMPGRRFRGALVLARHAWVVEDQAAELVAFVSAELYERPPDQDGEGRPRCPTPCWEGKTAGLPICVDPDRWGCGHGRAALTAIATCEELADAQWLETAIRLGHLASERCAQAAGFSLADVRPDAEGMRSWIRRGQRRPFARMDLCRAETKS